MRDAGASEQEIINAYASGYREYIEQHNERFTTLPIYHSDIHFDETTPHGHDAIVVMGHTEKGNPSDSINNALGELYGYPKTFEDKKANMERYRAENDTIMFDAIAPKLEDLASDYGLDIQFEPIRTGQEGSLSVEEYKHKKDLEQQENALQGRQSLLNDLEYKKTRKLDKRENELNKRELELESKEDQLEQQRLEQLATAKRLKEEAEENERQRKENERQRKENERKSADIKRFDDVTTVVCLAVLKDDEARTKSYKAIEKNGAFEYSPDSLKKVLTNSINDANKGIRRRQMGNEYFINQQIAQREAEQDGPQV